MYVMCKQKQDRIYFVQPRGAKRVNTTFEYLFPTAEAATTVIDTMLRIPNKRNNVHSRNAYLFLMAYLHQSKQNPQLLHDLVRRLFFKHLSFFPLFSNPNLGSWIKNRGRLQFYLIPDNMVALEVEGEGSEAEED